ncbi:alpha-ribazole phosphatase [Clostridium niameyense]|uniref:Alpha-ribazole phosphatase n=1 Tax=Clostridium niameyense TaxID=1622073 RepID=A0A6M0RBU0_9CLOT|nr:alpha-ribazole phosphatase [Clostridium niameyense]NEZ47029.1 alpha-ribazole phosphatase [Clostridium niameyense]
MNIYLVRHGETEENKNKNYYGKMDVSLNKRGVDQSKKVGKFLENIKFNKVYVSNRKRAKDTANIILKKNKASLTQGLSINNLLIEDSRINELNFGGFEGKTYDEIGKLYPEQQRLWEMDWKNFTPPSGESAISFFSKAKDFIESIKKQPEGNYLIVTHGGVIRMIYAYLLKEDMDFYWNFSSRNGDITLIKYEYENLFIDYIVPIGLL